MKELVAWIQEQAGSIAAQHSQLADDRLVLQGRHEACDLILQKIVELDPSLAGGVEESESVESEALAATSTDAEEAAAESLPV
jgi:hypothetical protein